MTYYNKVKESTYDNVLYYKAIDWNTLEDMVDKLTWEKLTEQFWLDTRIPVSNDLDDWRSLSQKERDTVGKAFVGLTLLDTLQSEEGAIVLAEGARTQHEIAIWRNIAMMEAIHAKSYSTIFSTLNTKAEIQELFNWGNNNEHLQLKARIINNVYQQGIHWKNQIASVFLESFLFYSGFYTPLWYLGNNKLPNVAEIIKLICNMVSLTGDSK